MCHIQSEMLVAPPGAGVWGTTESTAEGPGALGGRVSVTGAPACRDVPAWSPGQAKSILPMLFRTQSSQEWWEAVTGWGGP